MLPDPSQPRKYKRCRRYNDAGHAHSFTFSCFQRRPFLSKDRTRSWLIDALKNARRKLRFDLWVYVIMPEHAHVLIWPTEENYDVSAILTAIKVPVTRRALAFVQRYAPHFLPQMLDRQPNGKASYRFWQRGGGFDRNLVKSDAVWATIEYIHANPVRRGLCEHPADWPWSSAGFYAGKQDVLLKSDIDSLPTHGGIKPF